VAIAALNEIFDFAGRSLLETTAADEMRSIGMEVVASLPGGGCAVRGFVAIEAVDRGRGHSETDFRRI
jgi:hypothetical protein